MIRRALLALFVVAGCSSGDEVKLDYTVSFTDVAGKSKGAVDSGSLSSIQSSVPPKTLMGSTATFEVKSDMAGLHFTVVEDGMRKGQLTCTAQPGSGEASADAPVTNGGHYLVFVSYKGARCIPEQ